MLAILIAGTADRSFTLRVDAGDVLYVYGDPSTRAIFRRNCVGPVVGYLRGGRALPFQAPGDYVVIRGADPRSVLTGQPGRDATIPGGSTLLSRRPCRPAIGCTTNWYDGAYSPVYVTTCNVTAVCHSIGDVSPIGGTVSPVGEYDATRELTCPLAVPDAVQWATMCVSVLGLCVSSLGLACNLWRRRRGPALGLMT
jgi:hypothetical protein